MFFIRVCMFFWYIYVVVNDDTYTAMYKKQIIVFLLSSLVCSNCTLLFGYNYYFCGYKNGNMQLCACRRHIHSPPLLSSLLIVGTFYDLCGCK